MNNDDHPCKIECQRKVHKGYQRCADDNECDYAQEKFSRWQEMAAQIVERHVGRIIIGDKENALYGRARADFAAALRADGGTAKAMEGWPSDAAWEAGYKVYSEASGIQGYVAWRNIKEIVAAMLAAAPSPNGDEESSGVDRTTKP